MTRTLRFVFCVLLYTPLAAHSAPTMELYGTFEAMGVTVKLDSANDANRVDIAYRAVGEPTYRQGLPLARVHGVNLPRFAGSLFWLKPGQGYQVVATIRGGNLDGTVLGPQTASTRSEADVTPPSRTPTLNVSVGGTGNACSSLTPCALQTAIGLAVGGDVILMQPGTYKLGELTLSQNAPTPNAPLLLRAATAGSVVFDGSVAPTFSWQPYAGSDTYRAAYRGLINIPAGEDLDRESLVVMNGQRLYPYASLPDLQALAQGLSGFYADTSYLYVHLTTNAAPAAGSIAVSEHFYALRVRQPYTFFENLKFRYYGRGKRGRALRLDQQAYRTVVRGCIFQVNDIGVGVGLASDDNLIEQSQFFDTVENWPWDAVKAAPGELEGGGVFFDGDDGQGTPIARGTVIRRNRFENYFDGTHLGLYYLASSYPALEDSNETDFYDNEVLKTGDDGIELDYYSSNVRVWNNRFHRAYYAVSVAPVLGGPVYLLRNLVYDLKVRSIQGTQAQGSSFKFGYTSPPGQTYESGPMYFFHNTVDAHNASNTTEPHNALNLSGPTWWSALCARNNIFLGSNYALLENHSGVPSFYGDCGSPAGALPVSLDCDALWSTTLGKLALWEGTTYSQLSAFQQATHQEPNGLAEAPSFTDSGHGDYSLVQGSALVDAGCLIPGINDDYAGPGPDIGYAEATLLFQDGFETGDSSRWSLSVP